MSEEDVTPWVRGWWRLAPVPAHRIGEAARLAALAHEGPLKGGLGWSDATRLVGAFDGSGRLIGVVVATTFADGAATIDQTAVSPCFRRRGVATGLLEELVHVLASGGVTRVRVESPFDRAGVLGRLVRFGFRVVGVQGGSEPVVVAERRLDGPVRTASGPERPAFAA